MDITIFMQYKFLTVNETVSYLVTHLCAADYSLNSRDKCMPVSVTDYNDTYICLW